MALNLQFGLWIGVVRTLNQANFSQHFPKELL